MQRFNALQINLWLIKVWFSVSTFLVNIATFRQALYRYHSYVLLLVCPMFKFFAIAPGIEGESPQARELSETGSYSWRGLVPKSPFVRPLHRPSNYQQWYGRILASECVDAKTEMLTLHANIPCTRYLKRR